MPTAMLDNLESFITLHLWYDIKTLFAPNKCSSNYSGIPFDLHYLSLPVWYLLMLEAQPFYKMSDVYKGLPMLVRAISWWQSYNFLKYIDSYVWACGLNFLWQQLSWSINISGLLLDSTDYKKVNNKWFVS